MLFFTSALRCFFSVLGSLLTSPEQNIITFIVLPSFHWVFGYFFLFPLLLYMKNLIMQVYFVYRFWQLVVHVVFSWLFVGHKLVQIWLHSSPVSWLWTVVLSVLFVVFLKYFLLGSIDFCISICVFSSFWHMVLHILVVSFPRKFVDWQKFWHVCMSWNCICTLIFAHPPKKILSKQKIVNIACFFSICMFWRK